MATHIDALADALLSGGEDGQGLSGGEDGQGGPGIGGGEFDGFHFAAAVGVAAFDNAGGGLGVRAGLEQEDVLLGVLAADFDAAQKLRGLVAAHGPDDELELACH